VNFLCAMRDRLRLTAADRLLAVTTIAFDIANLELWVPLVIGARVELVTRTVAADGRQLLAALRDRAATTMQATPTTWRLLIDAGWDGHPSLKVLCGGEALPRDLAAALRKRSAEVWNLYGPTETTIWSAAMTVPAGDVPVPIGAPIANTQLYVLDHHMAPVPIGVAGELYIGGDGLARGYLNRPELTAQRFVPDPFSADRQARLYKTGDQVRYRADGTLEFLGRLDQQVKLRGFRIELGEIEATLEKHPAIREAVVSLRDLGNGDARLIAYLVAAPGADVHADDLRHWLKATLPDYMVPASFHQLDRLPLTPNGKVDRAALSVAAARQVTDHTVAVRPRTATESRLADIWADMLRLEQVGVNQDFFELGGHSLVATRIISRVREVFNVELPLRTLFDAPTVAGLAAAIDRAPERSVSTVALGGKSIAGLARRQRSISSTNLATS
jgi:acyl-coenzyme A synthetase/AMP-(fatty) acid ligase/acyl carrier protein